MLRGVSNALAVLFTSLAALTVLWLAIPLVSGGQIDGVYLALLPLTAIASFEAVQPLALALQQLEASQAAGRRLFELIDAAPEVRDPDQPVPVQPRPPVADAEGKRYCRTDHAYRSSRSIRRALSLQPDAIPCARRRELHVPGGQPHAPSSGRADRANRRL